MNKNIKIGMDSGDQSHLIVVLDKDGTQIECCIVNNTKIALKRYFQTYAGASVAIALDQSVDNLIKRRELNMKAIKTMLFFSIVLIFSTNAFSEPSTSVNKSKGDNIRITILYDSFSHNPDTQTGFGFSCLIETNEKSILFDTGMNPDVLLNNAKALDRDLKQIDIVIISHNHFDHTDGFPKISGIAGPLTVYLPHSMKDTSLPERAKKAGDRVVFVKDSIQIADFCHLTGELGGLIKEQSLIIDTKLGIVVVAGCSHPGIVNIIKTAKELTQKDVYMVIGGFHLTDLSQEEQREVVMGIKSMGVKKCGPCHCSGNRDIFKQAFGSDYIGMGTGKAIEISEN